jgi:flagella basal body P-ring formation protein FlgA
MRRSILRIPLLAFLFGASGQGAAARDAVPADVIRAAIEETWSQAAPPHATLEIRALPILPGTAAASVEVLLPEGIDRAGSRAIPVMCLEGARVVSRGLASVVIRVEREVWIAARALRRGELVDPTAFVRETRTFAREPRPLLQPQPTERYRLLRDVPAGVIVYGRDVRKRPDIESGDEVILVAGAGGARVTVLGRARRSGDVGDVILVHNPVNGAIVRARVLNPTTAELILVQTRSERRSEVR